MKRYYKRENYLKRIRGFYNDSSMIKVIPGFIPTAYEMAPKYATICRLTEI